MSWKTFCAICGLGLLALVPAAAEHHEQAGTDEEMAAMMEAWNRAMTPGEPHAQLARAAGSWTMRIEMWMDPEGEPMASEGKAERKMTLGGRILEEHMESQMMGQPFTGVARSGYDNVTARWWSTWTDSMSTGVYVSYGEAAEDGTVTYRGEYKDPVRGGMIQARAVVRWVDDDTQIFEWHEDSGSGETKTMEITYKRVRKE